MSKDYFDRLADGEVLPSFRRDDLKVNQYMKPEERQRRLDARTDIMATILAAYPTTSTAKLAKEYGVTPGYIEQLANSHGVRKSSRIQGRTQQISVEKVDASGKVVATYKSVNEAAKQEGVKYSVFRRMKDGGNVELNGYTFRFKKQNVRKRRNSFDLDLLQNLDYDDETMY